MDDGLSGVLHLNEMSEPIQVQSVEPQVATEQTFRISSTKSTPEKYLPQLDSSLLEEVLYLEETDDRVENPDFEFGEFDTNGHTHHITSQEQIDEHFSKSGSQYDRKDMVDDDDINFTRNFNRDLSFIRPSGNDKRKTEISVAGEGVLNLDTDAEFDWNFTDLSENTNFI